jgi:hypothetical protein
MGKPKFSGATFSTKNPAWTSSGSNPGLHGERPWLTVLRHSMAQTECVRLGDLSGTPRKPFTHAQSRTSQTKIKALLGTHCERPVKKQRSSALWPLLYQWFSVRKDAWYFRLTFPLKGYLAFYDKNHKIFNCKSVGLPVLFVTHQLLNKVFRAEFVTLTVLLQRFSSL